MQNTHTSASLRQLHLALLDILSLMNEPRRDAALIAAAGIPLDRALFPLLVLIERFGPLGIVELADRAGRDHTTVSRQVARLESLGLIARQGLVGDARVRQAAITQRGGDMTRRLDAARENLARRLLADWPEAEVNDLGRLLRRLADAARALPPEPAEPAESAAPPAPPAPPPAPGAAG